MTNSIKDSIVLMGCKHCGKSTQGKLLAEKLSVNFFDVDEEIARLKGTDVRTFYAKNGVAAFVLAEEEACNEIITKNENKQIVIATGGGICDNPPALNLLRPCGTFVFLRLDIKYSVGRIMAKVEETEMGTFKNVPAYILDENPKSLKQIEDILTNKFNERYKQYQSIADVIVDIKNAPIEENFKTLLGALKI